MELKIFSLNCWLLPPPFSANNKQRIENIISTIKREDPDIIALQEVWLHRYTEQIEFGLPNYSFIKSNSKYFNKSGLLTGTKNTINDYNIGYFPKTSNYGTFEKIAQKGYQIIHISSNTSFINTHLYCSNKNTEESIKTGQFEILQDLHPSKNLILGGDLNINEAKLKGLNSRFIYDDSNGSSVSRENPFNKALFNRFGNNDHKVDYILISRNTGASVTTRYIEDPVVSDHYMLVSDIQTITPRST